MNAYASSQSGFGEFGRRLEDWMENAEVEFRQAVSYIDRVIVPELRRETGSAARLLAGHLERLADKLHPLDEANEKRGL